MESSFLELRCKEVINVTDGRKLGHIVDLIFDLPTGKICGLVVPGDKNFWNIFKSGNELFIPYNQICKIGDDTILVELFSNNCSPSSPYPYVLSNSNNQNKQG